MKPYLLLALSLLLYFSDSQKADIYYTAGLNPDEHMYANVLNNTTLTQSDFSYSFEETEGKLHATEGYSRVPGKAWMKKMSWEIRSYWAKR